MINLYPAPYSKGQEVELVSLSIKSYPGQKANTVEAINGKAYEYSINATTRRPVGCLAEIHNFVYKQMRHDNRYKIVCSNGFAIIRYEDGVFVLEKAIVNRKA